jgi:hypothetical protein
MLNNLIQGILLIQVPGFHRNEFSANVSIDFEIVNFF